MGTTRFPDVNHGAKKISGIPPAIAATVIKPEENPEEDAKDLSIFHTEEGTSEKALVTAICPSTEPAVFNHNLKGASAERTDDEET